MVAGWSHVMIHFHKFHKGILVIKDPLKDWNKFVVFMGNHQWIHVNLTIHDEELMDMPICIGTRCT